MSVSALKLAKALRKFLDPARSFELSESSASARWLADLGLGSRVGKELRLTREEASKARVSLLRLLEAPSFAALDASPGTRSETLALTNNEKLLGASPRSSRVAVKAFPGQPLILGARQVWLDDRDNLEIDCESVSRLSGHDAVVLVENWESFERLPSLDASVCHRLPQGCSPLAIWRGAPDHPSGAALKALLSLTAPKFAYVDLDPAGLSIALSVPNLVDMLAPPLDELEELFQKRGRPRLFADQMMPRKSAPMCAKNWASVFELCNRLAVGVPQEIF